MSFLKRLVIAIMLLLLLGIPLSAMYYDAGQTLVAQSDEEPSVQQGNLDNAGRQ